MSGRGRSCPLDYRYAPEDLARSTQLKTETIYVIGGLYGNKPALDAILALCQRENSAVTLIFNGDFNWFNVDDDEFQEINRTVLAHMAIRGNVETELARQHADVGCGCGYPEWIDEKEVTRSNAILARLRKTACRFPDIRERLGVLPMYVVAEVGGVRIGILHGDTEALNGWRFGQAALDDPNQLTWVQDCFRRAQVQIFACTHTCLPVLREYDLPKGRSVIMNNGTAGMPNFRDSHYGLVTRISTRPTRQSETLYGTSLGAVYLDAIPVSYDHAAWARQFLANWPPGSPAYVSYWTRIQQGPAYSVEQARAPVS